MLFVVSASIVITTLRFGSGIIDENFVPELASRYKNSVEFLSYYALINFYLYTMAYVYSPAKNAAIDSLFRDNPTFSMINDSDEDVVYGFVDDERDSIHRFSFSFLDRIMKQHN